MFRVFYVPLCTYVPAVMIDGIDGGLVEGIFCQPAVLPPDQRNRFIRRT